MATASREPTGHLGPFRFPIKRVRDGRLGWYLYNVSGTMVGRHAAGFPSELEAYQDIQRARRARKRAHYRREQAIADRCNPRMMGSRSSFRSVLTSRERR
jgi:hypothetical protein